MDRWSCRADAHRVVLEHIGTARRLVGDRDHRPRHCPGLNGAIAPQPPEEQRRQHRCAEHRDPLAKTKLGSLAEQEGGAEDLDALICKLSDRRLCFAFDTAVKDVGLWIGADGADEQELGGAGAEPGAAQSDYEGVIDSTKRLLRPRLLDG